MRLTLEDIHHINIVNWFHEDYPQMWDDFHHFANQRKCSVQYGYKLKQMGVKKGVSDFFLAVPRNGYSGLWVELKVEKGRLSKEQTSFIERKNQRGYFATAVWGKDAAKEVIKAYLK